MIIKSHLKKDVLVRINNWLLPVVLVGLVFAWPNLSLGAACQNTTPGGDYVVNVSCTPLSASVDGADNGDIYVTSTASLTINNGQTLVYNSGRNIYVRNGSLIVSSGGVIQQTNLWMTDADGDGWPANLTQIAQNASTTNQQRRRNVMLSVTVADCNDGAYSLTNTCYSQGYYYGQGYYQGYYYGQGYYEGYYYGQGYYEGYYEGGYYGQGGYYPEIQCPPEMECWP